MPLANGTKSESNEPAPHPKAAVHLVQAAAVEAGNSTATESSGSETQAEPRLDALSIMGITAAILTCAVIFDYWARRTTLDCDPRSDDPVSNQRNLDDRPDSEIGRDDRAYGLPVDDNVLGPDSDDGDRDFKVACRAGDLA